MPARLRDGAGGAVEGLAARVDVLRYAGAAYLLWLGIKAWRAPVSTGTAADPHTRPRAGALYAAALGTGLSNPKLIIFAAALFPQFLDVNRPFWTQLAILVVSFAVIEGGWYLTYALGGRSLARWLAPAHRQRRFNRATGAMFIGFGGALLASRV